MSDGLAAALRTANTILVARLQDEYAESEGAPVGLNLADGETMDPVLEGVYDSFRVLRNCIASSTGIASNLLLCDELLKARQMVSTCTTGDDESGLMTAGSARATRAW